MSKSRDSGNGQPITDADTQARDKLKGFVQQIVESRGNQGNRCGSIKEYANVLYELPPPPHDMSPRDYHLLARDLGYGLGENEQREARLAAFLMGLENGTLSGDAEAGKVYTDFDPTHGGYDFYDHARREIEAAGGYCTDGGMLGM